MNGWTQTDFDAIVVGTGPGGATVARELSKRGKKVLVLERGSGKPIQGTKHQFLSFGVIPGRSLFITPQFLALFQAIIYGGSSIASYASAFDPPYEMFDKYGIDLRPEVAEAKKELPIARLPMNWLVQLPCESWRAHWSLATTGRNYPRLNIKINAGGTATNVL